MRHRLLRYALLVPAFGFAASGGVTAEPISAQALAKTTEQTQAQPLAGTGLSIELNAVSPKDGACSIVFLLSNRGENAVQSAVFEAVLFNRSGAVERLTLFDFGSLPALRLQVRQLVISDLTCDRLGSVLINGAETCLIDGAASAFCEESLRLESRIDIQLIG